MISMNTTLLLLLALVLQHTDLLHALRCLVCSLPLSIRHSSWFLPALGSHTRLYDALPLQAFESVSGQCSSGPELTQAACDLLCQQHLHVPCQADTMPVAAPDVNT